MIFHYEIHENREKKEGILTELSLPPTDLASVEADVDGRGSASFSQLHSPPARGRGDLVLTLTAYSLNRYSLLPPPPRESMKVEL